MPQSADVSAAFAGYRSAVASAKLAATQLDRARLLFDKGTLPQKDLEVAEDADARAKIAVGDFTADQIHVIGADVNHPTSTVDILAPASGVITEQNVAAAAGVKTLDNSPIFHDFGFVNVWILCDVYESDLGEIHVGKAVSLHLNAYPDRVLTGRVGSIGPVLDPTTRTAKVRVEMPNPDVNQRGHMQVGMFVTAEFHRPQTKKTATSNTLNEARRVRRWPR